MSNVGNPIKRQQRRAAEREAAKDASSEAEFNGQAFASYEEQAAIEREMANLASHPSAQAESHIGAAYFNMQAMAMTNERNGRHFLLSMPIDLADLELLEIIGWLSGPFRKELVRRRDAGEDKPKPALAIARTMPKDPPLS